MSSNEEHYAYAMQLLSSTSLTMVLATTIKLKVLEAIAEAGPDAQLSAHEIVSHLLIPNKDAPNMLDRMLRLLATHSVVTCTQREDDGRPIRVYGLAPVAKFFIPNEDRVSLAAMMELQQDKVFLESWFKLKDAVFEGGTPFDKIHGAHAFEYPTSDEKFNTVFNNAPTYLGIEHVGGDMFQEVPQGEAIFMKWILNDWSDDRCVKLLKNCYKALPSKGKVILVEMILPFLPGTTSSDKCNAQADAVMMTQNPGGKLRTEDELLVLAKGAGFREIKKVCFACDCWVVEFYK